MNAEELRDLAGRIAAGTLAVEDFVAAAMQWKTADLGDACIDLDRRRRCGFPEVVFAEGKTVDQLRRILTVLTAEGVEALATRVSAEKAAALSEAFPAARYNLTARTLRVPSASPAQSKPSDRSPGRVVVVTAGTSDLPVAEEARETALWMGVEVELIQDVGVAGPQRLLSKLPEIRRADAVVVVAGMEAALAGVVGGHVDSPVIAVPTSVGYGASLGGFTALLGMLSCCAANVTVVNIDAGFKGGYIAALIAGKVRAGGPTEEQGRPPSD
jgi:NCAIR mutase (PurE)-related protein